MYMIIDNEYSWCGTTRTTLAYLFIVINSGLNLRLHKRISLNFLQLKCQESSGFYCTEFEGVVPRNNSWPNNPRGVTCHSLKATCQEHELSENSSVGVCDDRTMLAHVMTHVCQSRDTCDTPS